MPESNIVLHQPWHRKLMGRVFNLMVSVVVLGGFRDTQCGFKAFSARAVETIFPRQQLNGFGFDVELLYIARLHRLPVKEIPVMWIDSPASRVRPWRDARRMFVDLLRIRRQSWQGLYR
jgi:dolichyl-phosphate beta-glucosyltransferase